MKKKSPKRSKIIHLTKEPIKAPLKKVLESLDQIKSEIEANLNDSPTASDDVEPDENQ